MFSKYDVYTTVQSMYCYPDTDVLINKLDIRDKTELKQAEEEFTAVKQMALLQERSRDVLPRRTCFEFIASFLKMCTPLLAHPQRTNQQGRHDVLPTRPD